MSHAAVSYAQFWQTKYRYQQEHRSLGAANLIHSPDRKPGRFVEPAVSGMTLQISLAIRSGTAELDFGAGRFTARLASPTFVIAPPDQVCSLALPNSIDILMIEFPRDHFADYVAQARDLGQLHSASFHDELPILLAKRLWAESARGLEALAADHMLHALATLLVRTSGEGRSVHAGGLASWQERRTTEYLADNLAKNVDLGTLAGVAQLSPYHFARAFKRSTGLPPHAYLRRLRLERAKALLVETDLPVTEIALAVGYDSPQALARLFQREVGISPNRYRRERRS